jgi:hypothetical protein
MSPEHSPARAGASCSAPDASLTIDEFCQAEKISRSSRSRTLFFVRRQGTCRGMLSANRDDNRDEIRDVKSGLPQLAIFLGWCRTLMCSCT